MTEQLSVPAAIIDGVAVETDDRIEVVDPFTNTVIGSTGQADAGIVGDAVASAVAAQRAWADTSVGTRADILRRTADAFEQNGNAIPNLVTSEMGMPTALATATQQVMPAAVLRAMADTAKAFPWRSHADGAELQHVPAGVIAAITPWNMPVHQIIAKVSAAFATGCAVVLKPSEMTPFDAVRVRELFIAAGLPEGVFAIVNGTGRDVGATLAARPGIAHVSFTGSVAAGKAVAAAAASTLARTTLELGGKSPAVVLPDADLQQVIPRVIASGLVNSGQACNATTRLVLPRAHAAEIESLIVESVSTIRLGDPRDRSTVMGPLASRRQAERVLDHIGKARADGGNLLTGTGDAVTIGASDNFIAPTVITGLEPTAHAVREEIFGPVLVVQYYDDVAGAVEIANDCDYGLSAEVWSSSPGAAKDVAAALDVGQVKVNGVRTRERPAVPFGGVKQSGYGRELGAAGLSEFTEIRAVMS